MGIAYLKLVRIVGQGQVLFVYRCRDNFYPAVKIVPAMCRTVIFAVDFVLNVFRTVTAWIVYIGTGSIHPHSRIFVRRLAAKA